MRETHTEIFYATRVENVSGVVASRVIVYERTRTGTGTANDTAEVFK